MPEFGDVKQAHLPPQAKPPGNETRFIREGGGGSGDWMTQLGNAIGNFLEQGVKDVLRLPVDLVAGTVKGVGDGLAAGGKSIIEGLKDAVKEIKQDSREPSSNKNEARSSPQSARPSEGSARNAEHQAKAQEAKSRERDSSQNNSPKYGQVRPNGPSSSMEPAQHKTWADAPSHATTSIKVQEYKEPTIRKYGEPAKDAAARTASPPDQAQTVKKETEAPAVVRKDHAPIETPEQKKWEASDYKVSAEKTNVKTVDSVLQEIRAAKEIPREKARESERAPEKSPERTR